MNGPIGLWLAFALVAAASLMLGHALASRKRMAAGDAGGGAVPVSGEVESIIATAYDAYVAIDPASVILDWNQQAERTFGWTRDEVLGRNMAELIIPVRYRAGHRHGIRHYLDTGEGPALNQRIELSAVHRDGHEFPIELTVWPTRIRGELRFHAFLHDISARHRALWRLTAQTAAAEALVSSTTLAAAAPKVLSTVCMALGWKAGALWLVEESGQELRCIEFWSPQDAGVAHFADVSRQMRFQPGIGLPGRVLATGKAAWIADVVADGNFPRAGLAAESGLHAAFGFPILSDGKVIGVVEYFSASIEEPDPQLLGMMETLGRLLGQFIVRIRVERALEHRNEFLDALLDNITEGIVACDEHGVLTVFNHATRELHGLPAESIPPEQWAEHYDLYLADGGTRMEMEQIPLFRALNGEQVRGVEMVIVPKGRPRRVLVCNGRALISRTGEKLGAVVALHDITERKQIETELRQSRSRLAEAQHVAQVGSWEWDIDTDTVHWSEEMYRLFGLDPLQFEATFAGFLDRVHADDRDRVRKNIEAALDSLQAFEFQHRIVRGDGEIRMMQSRGQSIADAAGRVIRMVGTGQDITERSQGEHRLR